MKLVPMILLFASASLLAKPVTRTSAAARPLLLEMYVSQGCSSCPPAQEWLYNQVDRKRLFKDIVPVIFHVDYWDYLGWQDPFGSHTYSRRQKELYRAGAFGSVYTPALLTDGKEWRGWHRGTSLPAPGTGLGTLTATTVHDTILIKYDRSEENMVVHTALIGTGLYTRVTAGENEGARLREDYTVLAYSRYPAPAETIRHVIRRRTDIPADGNKLIIWVTLYRDPVPLQVLVVPL